MKKGEEDWNYHHLPMGLPQAQRPQQIQKHVGDGLGRMGKTGQVPPWDPFHMYQGWYWLGGFGGGGVKGGEVESIELCCQHSSFSLPQEGKI